MYKKNFDDTVQRMDAWFHNQPLDRPMVRLIGIKDENYNKPKRQFANFEDKHIGAKYNVETYRDFCENSEFMLESFPNMKLDLGAGSMATYLGCQPNFSNDTVWYNANEDLELEDYTDFKFDENNKWFKKHCDELKEAVKLANGDFLVTIPDIIENLDILSAMRGPANLCYDMIDYPELVEKFVGQIDDLYFKYYDIMRDIVKTESDVSAYTTFNIMGHGKIAKIQCDHAALISPADFDKFVVPSLTKQADQLDGVLFHLDGKECIRHLDSVLSIKGISALQWTAGAGQPDGGDEKWYEIYDKVHESGKGLWVSMYDGTTKEIVQRADNFVKRYGKERTYIILRKPVPMNEALEIQELATTKWAK